MKRWDQPRQRFVASSQAAGSAPILSFIPFALPGDAHDAVAPEFSMVKNFELKLDVSNNTETHENQNRRPVCRYVGSLPFLMSKRETHLALSIKRSEV